MAGVGKPEKVGLTAGPLPKSSRSRNTGTYSRRDCILFRPASCPCPRQPVRVCRYPARGIASLDKAPIKAIAYSPNLGSCIYGVSFQQPKWPALHSRIEETTRPQSVASSQPQTLGSSSTPPAAWSGTPIPGISCKGNVLPPRIPTSGGRAN